MNNKKEGNVKSTKLNSLWNRIGKKVSAGVVGLGLVVGTVFGFVGCTNNPTPTPNPPEPPPIVVVEEMKFDEFISKHTNVAHDFVEDFIRDDVVQDKEVKSESWSISAATDDTKIGGVSILYTYDVNETDRAVELANVTLSSPVSINKIVDKEVSKSDIKMSIDRKTVFEFDAKDNYDNQDITNALYASENKTSDMKLIAETEAKYVTNNAYNYIVAKNGKIDTYKVEVEKGDGSNEYIIFNFENGNKSKAEATGSYSMNGTNIENVGYKYEEIESENPGPGPIDPDKPPVEVTVSNQEILDFLDKNVKIEAAKKCLSSSWEVNETNVKDATWYVTKDDNNVTGANLVFTYERRADTNYIILCNVEFTNPLTPQNIKDGKIGTPTYTEVYRKGINPTIQDQHANLTDAIGDKLFGVKEGAIRYIIDNGVVAADPQLKGDVSTFTAIEITDKGIKENSIKILYANSDDGLISNLGDSSKYATYGEEKSVAIEGKDLTKTDIETTKTNRMAKESIKEYFGEEDSNDDDLTM